MPEPDFLDRGIILRSILRTQRFITKLDWNLKFEHFTWSPSIRYVYLTDALACLPYLNILLPNIRYLLSFDPYPK